MKIPFIGLMGVGSDNMLYTPSGVALFRVSPWAARMVQQFQHWIARKTWNYCR